MNSIGVPNYTGVDKVDVSVEPVTTLDGAPVDQSHLQRFLLAFRTAAGVAWDVPGDPNFGLLVQLARFPTTTSWTMTAVAVNATTGVQLVDGNLNRKGLKIFNDSTYRLRIKYDAVLPVVSPFTVPIAPGGYWEMPSPINTGTIVGLWDAAETDINKTGANITEEL